MSGADPSIYSLIQQPKITSPIEAYGGVLQLQQLMDQSQLAGLQRKQLMDADAENQRISDLFSSGKTPTEAEVFAASPKTGLTYQKTLLENKKTQSEIDKNRIAGLRDTIDIFRNALGPVNDQGAYTAWRTSLVKEMPQFAGTVPEQFSPESKRDLLLKADELGKQLVPRFEKVDIGGRIEMVDVNPITNPGIKGMQFTKTQTPDSVASNETTRRGQNMTQATAQRGQNMTDARERDVELQGRITAAREGAKNTVEAQRALPQAVDAAERGKRLIDDLLKSPGFSDLVGATYKPGFRFIPGTAAADAQARLDEIKGGAFMQAFQSLRGGGQITEKEGEKATAAITRMSTSQSEGEFRKAAAEFKQVMDDIARRAKVGATGPYAGGQSTARRDGLGGVLTKNPDGSFNYGF